MSAAGAAGVQVHCSITTLHYTCLITSPYTLLLPHAVSSLSILRDRGDGGDSQQGFQTMPLSTSATLMVVMTTHLSEGLVRDVHAERHGVARECLRAPIGRAPDDTTKYSTYLRTQLTCENGTYRVGLYF